MNGAASSANYDQWHASLDVDFEADGPWHQLIRRHLDPGRDLAARRVLEIGCGRGGFSCWMAKCTAPPPNIVAIDYSPVAVEKARAHSNAIGLSSIQWQTGDIQAIEYPDATFDTVVSCETIEHVPDPPKAVRELARVLKPGGRLFLTTPNYFGLYGLYRGYLRLTGRRYTEVGQPINQFTMLPRTLFWLQRVGLRPEVVSGEGHYLLFPGKQPRRIKWLDREPLKWLALHALVIARKAE